MAKFSAIFLVMVVILVDYGEPAPIFSAKSAEGKLNIILY